MAKDFMDRVSMLYTKQDFNNPNKEISEEVSTLLLQARQAFTLGREQWMYPKYMLRYHYGNVPPKFFETERNSQDSVQEDQYQN